LSRKPNTLTQNTCCRSHTINNTTIKRDCGGLRDDRGYGVENCIQQNQGFQFSQHMAPTSRRAHQLRHGWPHSIDTMRWMIPSVDRSSPVPNQCYVLFAVITVREKPRRALPDQAETILLSISGTIFYLLVPGYRGEMGVEKSVEARSSFRASCAISAGGLLSILRRDIRASRTIAEFLTLRSSKPKIVDSQHARKPWKMSAK
jgi:hypothetical protein